MWFHVIVYPTTREMIDAANEHTKETGEDMKYTGSAGVCHTYQRLKITEKGEETLLNEIGTIRLAKTHLNTEVVSHEVLHAAMHLYRLLYGTEREYEGSSHNADFGSGCNPQEENLCYLFGEMFRDMNLKLHNNNLWQ